MQASGNKDDAAELGGGRGTLAARILGKFVLDVLPAALASVIGGFLFTQYHFGQVGMPQPPDGQPASAEMMAMVRDEHALIMNYLKAQMAAEQRRDLTEDADSARAATDAHAAADAKLADALRASQATAQHSAAPVTARRPKQRLRIPTACRARRRAACTAGHRSSESARMTRRGDDAPDEARDPDPLLANSLLAKTLDVKDHVVAATRRVVSVIGDMFASVGDSIGGAVSGSRQFNSAS